MSHPYNKHRGGCAGGRRIYDHGGNSDRAHGGHWNNQLASRAKGPVIQNKQHPNQQRANNAGGGSGGCSTQLSSVMSTLLNLLFQKSSNTIFDAQSGTLNLSKFGENPDLKDVQKSVDFNSVAFCKSLVSVVKANIGDALRIIVLNDNNVRKAVPFFSALSEAGIHGGVTAISATGNGLTDFGFLAPLKGYDNLGELLLEGNPVTQRDDYRPRVLRSLPNLMMLDGQVIDRALLRLPNPVPATLNEMQVGVLRFLEASLFATTAAGNYDTLVNVYSPNAVVSVSRSDEPLPSYLPMDAKHNCGSLNSATRSAIASDFAYLRKRVPWRNLHNDVHSLRNVSLGRAKASLTLKEIGGGEKCLSVSHELNSNANVIFLSQNMSVPICVVTLHGRIFWHWCPKASVAMEATARNEVPFFSCCFDRTLSLVLDTSGSSWSVHNDMIFLRPDHKLFLEDGSFSPTIFFANESQRVETMRRRYLQQATHDVMRIIVENTVSDADMQAFVTGHLATLPADRVQAALASSELMASIIKQ
ncbi:hypothetical protein ERJ75_000323600 [Trypanosoma vivax]|uniref:MEX67-like NTF2-like domain-containing protein n=1 Tax=Trypanosoma vivax (strain Y486) TaxID=1055687 RepID=G0UAB4_TRYVY|nr:hypothetical protein TRVL_01322 [Trypanosoma vivax]KAH8617932.1 hypothetical protein ERJ75_000323600 [Trypanosoma vivax]CCC52747.1 conserved hypothetical protein [Trypanosoma vivax Y486]